MDARNGVAMASYAPWSVIATRTMEGEMDFPVTFVCHECGRTIRVKAPRSEDILCECGYTFKDSADIANVLHWARCIFNLAAADQWA